MKAKILVNTRIGRKYIREEVNAGNSTFIKIVEGNSPPKLKGTSSYYTTKGGTIINYPNAYSKKGWGNMIYIPSSIRIEVGKDYDINIEDSVTKSVSYLSDMLYYNGLTCSYNSQNKTYSLDEFNYKDLSLLEFKKLAERILNNKAFL